VSTFEKLVLKALFALLCATRHFLLVEGYKTREILRDDRFQPTLDRLYRIENEIATQVVNSGESLP
jgi:hypothetical protein